MKNPKFFKILLASCITMQSCAIFAEDEPNFFMQIGDTIGKEIAAISLKTKNTYKAIEKKIEAINEKYVTAKKYCKENQIKVTIGATILGACSLWLAVKLLPKKVTITGSLAATAAFACWYEFVYKVGKQTGVAPVVPAQTPVTPAKTPALVPQTPATPEPKPNKTPVEPKAPTVKPEPKPNPTPAKPKAPEVTPKPTIGLPSFNPGSTEGQAWLNSQEGKAWLNSPKGKAWLASPDGQTWRKKEIEKEDRENTISFTQLYQNEKYDEKNNLIPTP